MSEPVEKLDQKMVSDLVSFLEDDIDDLVQDLETDTPEVIAALAQILEKYRKRLSNKEILCDRRETYQEPKKPKRLPRRAKEDCLVI